MNLEKISKYLSLILRHKPEEIGVTLDEHGYAKTSDIINGIRRKYPDFNKDALREIVETDEKQRYSFKDYENYIRANQGHSVKVNLELISQEPPLFLFHGTSDKYIESILEKGIIPKSRQYVHLSADTDTAHNVGLRHGGKTVIYIIDAHRMWEDGYKFYLSENKVWLTDIVPYRYYYPLYVNNSTQLQNLNSIVNDLIHSRNKGETSWFK